MAKHTLTLGKLSSSEVVFCLETSDGDNKEHKFGGKISEGHSFNTTIVAPEGSTLKLVSGECDYTFNKQEEVI